MSDSLQTHGFPVLHYLPEFAQTHVHWVDDAIHLILCHSLPLLPSVFPRIRVFSNESSLHQSFGASASVLPMSIQGWFPLGMIGLISLVNRTTKDCARTAFYNLWSNWTMSGTKNVARLKLGVFLLYLLLSALTVTQCLPLSRSFHLCHHVPSFPGGVLWLWIFLVSPGHSWDHALLEEHTALPDAMFSLFLLVHSFSLLQPLLE